MILPGHHLSDVIMTSHGKFNHITKLLRDPNHPTLPHSYSLSYPYFPFFSPPFPFPVFSFVAETFPRAPSLSSRRRPRSRPITEPKDDESISLPLVLMTEPRGDRLKPFSPFFDFVPLFSLVVPAVTITDSASPFEI